MYIYFEELKEEKNTHKVEMKKIAGYLNSIGLFPIKTISDYVTAHYAGGIPFRLKPGKLSVDKEGKLHQGKRIYVADSSAWRALPAKPPTLTIMAHASWVAKNVLKNFS